jgi:hypothetical protein
MKKIYSKVDPSVLLHVVFRYNDITEQRQDIAPAEEFLQASAFEIGFGKTYRPHKHIPCQKMVTIPQESWVVLIGNVRATFYDLDDTIVEQVVLGSGDMSMTFRGGHTYTGLADDTRIYEFKVPNYTGQTDDKVFIGE